jgi:hypothetical protein
MRAPQLRNDYPGRVRAALTYVARSRRRYSGSSFAVLEAPVLLFSPHRTRFGVVWRRVDRAEAYQSVRLTGAVEAPRHKAWCAAEGDQLGRLTASADLVGGLFGVRHRRVDRT